VLPGEFRFVSLSSVYTRSQRRFWLSQIRFQLTSLPYSKNSALFSPLLKPTFTLSIQSSLFATPSLQISKSTSLLLIYRLFSFITNPFFSLSCMFHEWRPFFTSLETIFTLSRASSLFTHTPRSESRNIVFSFQFIRFADFHKIFHFSNDLRATNTLSHKLQAHIQLWLAHL